MSVAQLNSDPVASGFYTVREAARLLSINNPQRVHGWLSGYAYSDAGPVIKRQYEPIGRAYEVSFLDLIELRFVEHFRRQRISLQSLRKAAKNARKELQQDHPFATSNVKFMTDRKEVFLNTAKETGDQFLLNLMTNQVEIYVALEQVLAKGITFHQRSGVAHNWRPLHNDCPNVIVDPRIAYGHPVVAPKNVPTSALFSLWKAESGDARAVADWFHVGRDLVDEAVEFELRLAA